MQRGFARFLQGKWPGPVGSLCLSSFVLALKRGSLLLGKVSHPDIWERQWALPTWKPSKWRGKLLLPATHLLLKEHPDQAAERIMRNMLKVSEYKLAFHGIQSHVRKRPLHWDICFIYHARIKGLVKKPPWFAELRYVEFKEIRREELGRDHADVIEKAGIRLAAIPRPLTSQTDLV